jgi:hypothetical protein
LFATDDVVLVVFAVTITGVDGVVVATVGVVVVGTWVVRTWVVGTWVVGTWVVTGDVEEGGGDEAAGSRGDEALRVKTSTSNRSGLDHIKRWALFSEKGERVMVFEG